MQKTNASIKWNSITLLSGQNNYIQYCISSSLLVVRRAHFFCCLYLFASLCVLFCDFSLCLHSIYVNGSGIYFSFFFFQFDSIHEKQGRRIAKLQQTQRWRKGLNECVQLVCCQQIELINYWIGKPLHWTGNETFRIDFRELHFLVSHYKNVKWTHFWPFDKWHLHLDTIAWLHFIQQKNGHSMTKLKFEYCWSSNEKFAICLSNGHKTSFKLRPSNNV